MGRWVIVAGLCLAAVFPVVALGDRLFAFADGAVFSYGVAAGEAWDIHWRHIASRVTVFLLAHGPAQLLGEATGHPEAAVALYTLIFYGAPFAGLVATLLLDRTPGRVFAVACAVGTLGAVPLVLPFPSETVFTHALFFPALALAHRGGGWRSEVALGGVMVALLHTHEAALVAGLLVVLSTLLLWPERRPFGVALCAFIAGLVAWSLVRAQFPPSDYVAYALATGAERFLAVENWGPRAVQWAAATACAGFGVAALLDARFGHRGIFAAVCLGVAGVVAAVLLLDPAVHASERYGVRLVLLVVDAAAAGIATLAAARARGTGHWLLQLEPPGLGSALARLAAPGVAALAVVVTLHLVEGTRFIAEWRGYTTQVARLANTDGPAVPRTVFASIEHVPARTTVGWNSTTPYLGILFSPGFMPRRLVFDPTTGYFWMDCRTAFGSLMSESPVPRPARALVALYACRHRL